MGLAQAHGQDIPRHQPERPLQERGRRLFAARQGGRARLHAPALDELDGVYPTDATVLTAPARFAETGDRWAGILDARQDLGALLGVEA